MFLTLTCSRVSFVQIGTVKFCVTWLNSAGRGSRSSSTILYFLYFRRVFTRTPTLAAFSKESSTFSFTTSKSLFNFFIDSNIISISVRHRSDVKCSTCHFAANCPLNLPLKLCTRPICTSCPTAFHFPVPTVGVTFKIRFSPYWNDVPFTTSMMSGFPTL